MHICTLNENRTAPFLNLCNVPSIYPQQTQHIRKLIKNRKGFVCCGLTFI